MCLGIHQNVTILLIAWASLIPDDGMEKVDLFQHNMKILQLEGIFREIFFLMFVF